MGRTKLSLKLLVDKRNNSVLFEEAGKEFVDFLFHPLSLPIATVAKLINVKDMVGCIGRLYSSIESLNSDCLLSNVIIDTVLNPSTGLSVPLLLLTDAPTSDEHEKRFYMCASSSGYTYKRSNIHKNVTDAPGQKCPVCSSSMSTEMAYVVPEESEYVVITSEGYVKRVVTYMVMDHLSVKSMSTIFGITLMNEFGVKDISSLVEKQAEVTFNEVTANLAFGEHEWRYLLGSHEK